MALAQLSAPWGPLLLLCLAAPISVWVAWSDMKRMKIPNKAVLALFAVYVVGGFLALPTDVWAWGFLNLVVVLLVGFLANMAGLLGAGDAKFAAAAAPFVALDDVARLLMLFAVILLAAFAAHRLARRVPAVRNLAPEWESWTRKDFPMGLALGATLICYLLLATL